MGLGVLLEGSRDLAIGVISKVTIAVKTSNGLLITLFTKSHDPPSTSQKPPDLEDRALRLVGLHEVGHMTLSRLPATKHLIFSCFVFRNLA